MSEAFKARGGGNGAVTCLIATYPVDGRLKRLVDGRHAALPQRGDDAIWPELTTDELFHSTVHAIREPTHEE